jgi:nucleoside-diphosphate-sugar epimerase
MKVFVTGGTGYIGNRLITNLLEQDHEVVALCRNGQPEVQHKRLTWKKGSLQDIESLVPLLEGCKQVYHVAALARMWHPQKNAFFDVNVTGTQHLLQAAQQAGVQKFLYTSSAAVFSFSIKSPITESDPLLEPFDDDYAITKFLGERAVMQASQPGFDTVVVNPPRVYGPSPAGTNAINNLVKHYLRKPFYFTPGDGSYIGNYAFIDDVVNGHREAMRAGKPGERYILGGENHSYTSFYQLLKKLTALKRRSIGIPYRVMKMIAVASEVQSGITGRAPFITTSMVNKIYSNRVLSNDKAIRDFDYKITPFAEGLTKTLEAIENGK